MKLIHNLEIHVAHGCNLSCESCSHYSNQGHKGLLSLEEADAWMDRWNKRIRPVVFTLLGGEPTIHPELAAFVLLARKHWPHSSLRIVTNGFFLHRHARLPAVLRATNTCLRISIHHRSADYREKLRPIFDLVKDWIQNHGVRVEFIESYKNWTRRYKGFGAAMQPFEDNQPRKSWEHCPARYCRQLFDGMIWKCAPLAYLKLQHARHGLSDPWQPYLQYKPLGSDCTEQELNAFFDREEESYCRMCPANPQSFELPPPLVSRPSLPNLPPAPPAQHCVESR